MDHPELEFFNDLSGELEIELSTPAQPIAEGLRNLAAPTDSKVVSLRLRPEVYVEEEDDFRSLTEDELSGIAYRGARITLRGESGDAVTHAAPNGEAFTVQELLDAVAETELRTRDASEWLGGVDVHHVFFEGLEPESDGVWAIVWGS